MNLRSDGRIDPVRRDQATRTDIVAGFKSRAHTTGILFERFHPLTWNQAPLLQLVPKRLMQIGPMYAQGRGFKPRHRDCRDPPSVWAVEVELGDGFTADKHLIKHA
jgi:hypothetical protein